MPTTPHRTSRVCPRCALPIAIVHTDDGVRAEYDIGDWTLRCHHPQSDSPLACPAVTPSLKTWLGNP
jgi:hypothetical protein